MGLFDILLFWYCDAWDLPSTAEHTKPMFLTFSSEHTEEEEDEETLQ